MLNDSQKTQLFGALDFASEKDDDGLTRAERFAAALDPLILPQMRMGEQIRTTGASRVKRQGMNKTVEWLKSNGYAEIAAMVQTNPTIASNVMSAIIAKKINPPAAKEQGQVVSAEMLRKIYPGTQIADGLYNISPTGNVTKVGGAGNTTNINMPGGPPAEDKLLEELMKKQGKDFGAYLDAGSAAAQAMSDLRVLQELAPMAPSGPITGRLAEAFPEFNDVTALRQSIVKRVGPTLRVEGSGATSDLEFKAMLNALGSLKNSPEANQAIYAVMMQKQRYNLERANIVRQYQTQKITLQNANDALAALESQSTIPAAVESILENYRQDDAPAPILQPRVRTWNPETQEFE